MRLFKQVTVLVITLGLLAILPMRVSAEWFIDLYSGVASSRKADVDVERQTGLFFTGRTSSATATADFDPAFTLGGRVGYWLERVAWLGLALDVSLFQPEAADVDITVVSFTPLVLLRYSWFINSDFPKGQLQPYVGIGPGFFRPEITADVRPTLPEKASETSTEIGIDARLGLAWQFLRHVAVFGEYRFTHTPIDARTKSEWGELFSSTAITTITTSLDTHQVLVGMSWRF